MKKGWQTKKLGDLCDVIGGGTPPKDKPAFYSGTIPWATVRDMRQDVITETEFRITKDAVKGSATNIIPSGNVVIATRVGLGKVCLLGQDTAINQDLRGLVPRSEKTLVVRYLYWWLKGIADVIIANGTGATVQGVKLPFVKSLQIPVPPLPEQQRIVALLDEAFAGLATAQAHAKRNLRNARALFESHLNAVFTQRERIWEATTLGAKIDLLAGFAFKSARYSRSFGDIRLLRGDNIIQGCLRWDEVKRWPADDTGDYERYQLEEGDVVLAMDRPWVKAGLKHATISADDLPCLLVQRTARLRGGPTLDNRFLRLLIGSSAFTSHILGVQTGIGVPHISGQQIKDFEFACPPLVEQRRLADNLECLRAETQRLTRLYEQKLEALESLKKSLLHQAFSGAL
jgi:type I restriction enzyme S subunit